MSEREQIVDDFIHLLESSAVEFGVELRHDSRAVAQYAAHQSMALQAVLAENPEVFSEALRASRDATVLFAAGRAIDAADSADQRLVGLVQGMLGTAARLLVAL